MAAAAAVPLEEALIALLLPGLQAVQLAIAEKMHVSAGSVTLLRCEMKMVVETLHETYAEWIPEPGGRKSCAFESLETPHLSDAVFRIIKHR